MTKKKETQRNHEERPTSNHTLADGVGQRVRTSINAGAGVIRNPLRRFNYPR